MAKKSKKKVTRTDHVWKFMGDGIWEMTLGLIVIWAGVIILMRWSFLWFLPAFIFFGLGIILKTKFIIPHAKKIQLPRYRIRAAGELVILTVVVLIILLSLLKDEPGLIGYWHYFQENALLMAAILSTLICFFIALITKSPQFYLHGILLFMTLILDAIFFSDKPVGLALGAGIVMLISGMVNLKRFIQP